MVRRCTEMLAAPVIDECTCWSEQHGSKQRATDVNVDIREIADRLACLCAALPTDEWQI